MNDNELINLIAKTWVDNCGDHLGFVYAQERIKEKIKELQ